MLLCRIAVLGAYVKRSGNLLFIRQQSEMLPISELSYAVEESLANLELMGVQGALSVPPGAVIPADDAIRIYAFFEKTVEAALGDLHSLYLYIHCEEEKTLVRLQVESGVDLRSLDEDADGCMAEDGIWSLSLVLMREVEADG